MKNLHKVKNLEIKSRPKLTPRQTILLKYMQERYRENMVIQDTKPYYTGGRRSTRIFLERNWPSWASSFYSHMNWAHNYDLIEIDWSKIRFVRS